MKPHREVINIHVRAYGCPWKSTKVQSSATLQHRVCSSMILSETNGPVLLFAYHYITIHIEIRRMSALRRPFRIFQQLHPFRINKLIVHSQPICICISKLTVSEIRIWQSFAFLSIFCKKINIFMF